MSVNAQTNTDMSVATTPINDDYEWIQYNERLRIIHSIKDDMYQMQSIISACNSHKPCKDWFRNQSTVELLESAKNASGGIPLLEKTHENGSGGIPPDRKIYENRPNLPNELKGTYIHRLLVNHVAMWASPTYAWYIMKLLDDIFQKQREQLNNKIEEMKPRQVPQNKQRSYKYMIWKEDIEGDDGHVKLHLVKRNTKTFYDMVQIYRSERNWFFRDNLPIAMTPNEDIKKIIKQNFTGNEATVKASTVIINKDCLARLHELVDNYFNNFQQ